MTNHSSKSGVVCVPLGTSPLTDQLSGIEFASELNASIEFRLLLYQTFDCCMKLANLALAVMGTDGEWHKVAVEWHCNTQIIFNRSIRTAEHTCSASLTRIDD